MSESEKPDSLIELIRHRRSVRKFDPEPVDPAALERAADAALLSPACSSSPSWNIKVFIGDEQKELCRKAATSGFKGKTNVWLATKDVPGMICVTANPDSAPKKGDKLFYLLESAVAFENFVLAARAADLGTCWLGAFDEAPVSKALGLPAGERIVALSPIGKPYKKQLSPIDLTGQYDRLAKKRMHRQRRPLHEIAFSEKYERPAAWDITPDPEALASARSAALDPDQIVPALLRSLAFVPTFEKKDIEDAKLNWILEAARLAPSASNSQIWRFVTIRSKEILWQLESCAHNDNGFQVPFPEAGAVIVALADELVARTRGEEQPYFMIDVPIAISHILLAAADLGLAANVILHFHENRVRRLIQAPMRSRVVALIALGYPPRRGAKGEFPAHMSTPVRPRKKGIVIV